MPSEIRQSEKATCCRIPLYEDPRLTRFVDAESRMVGPRSRGAWAPGSYWLMETISVWDNDRWWWWLHHNVNRLNATELWH